MARSRMVGQEEVQQTMTAGVRKAIDAALTPRGMKELEETTNQLADSWRACHFLLSILKRKPRSSKKEIYEMLGVGASKIATADQAPMTLEDLRVTQAFFDSVSAGIEGKAPTQPVSSQMLARFLSRHGEKEIKPRKFKDNFIKAIQAREQARSNGSVITLKNLAQQFTSDAYERNPESAIRAMGSALKRIELERQRLEKLGYKSAYYEVNTKIKGRVKCFV